MNKIAEFEQVVLVLLSTNIIHDKKDNMLFTVAKNKCNEKMYDYSI